MILVQNLRLPLSGSKRFTGLAILLIVLIAGCTPKVRVLRGAGSKTPPKTETLPEKDKEVAPAKEVEKVDVNSIALLLPFEFDKANANAPSASDIKRSALALDFYQGFKLGLDALAKEGANFKMNVLDTRDDVAENARIAKLDEVQDAALIVGPVYPKEIQVFGFNTPQGDALQISPLAASMPSEFNLPNLVTITAPLPMHVRALAAQIAKEYKNEDVVLLYNTQDAASKQLLSPLRAELGQLKKGIKVVEVQDDESLASNVHQAGINFVVLASTNKYQIAPILAKLHQLKDELTYQIQLYGHPNWSKMEFDESEGLSDFKTTITTSYYVDRLSSNARRFDQQYQSEFGIAPTEFAYKGYDAAYYFGGLLAKHPTDYRSYITKDDYQGLHNSFKFEYNPAWGYVNKAILMLQYRDGDFKLSN